MEEDKARNLNLPKRAFTKPSVLSIVFFILITIIWVPNTLPFFTNMASLQIFAAIFLAPLAVVALVFLSYNTGLSLAKYNYDKVKKGNLVFPYAILLVMHVLCILCCIVLEIILVGYPFGACFDTCQYIEMTTAIFAYSIVTTVLFLPAYYAIYRYYQWVVKYKAGVLSRHQNN